MSILILKGKNKNIYIWKIRKTALILLFKIIMKSFKISELGEISLFLKKLVSFFSIKILSVTRVKLYTKMKIYVELENQLKYEIEQNHNTEKESKK